MINWFVNIRNLFSVFGLSSGSGVSLYFSFKDTCTKPRSSIGKRQSQRQITAKLTGIGTDSRISTKTF